MKAAQIPFREMQTHSFIFHFYRYRRTISKSYAYIGCPFQADQLPEGYLFTLTITSILQNLSRHLPGFPPQIPALRFLPESQAYPELHMFLSYHDLLVQLSKIHSFHSLPCNASYIPVSPGIDINPDAYTRYYPASGPPVLCRFPTGMLWMATGIRPA